MFCLLTFTICDIKHNLPKNHKNIALKNKIFSIFMEFHTANKNLFHGFENLVIWLWKSLGNK